MHLPTNTLTWNDTLLGGMKRELAMRKCKRRKTVWRKATPEDYKWFQAQPQIEELGDFLFLATDTEDELWLLIERFWNGWPDPPLYAFLVFDLEGNLIAGGDFHRLPSAWTLPEPTQL